MKRAIVIHRTDFIAIISLVVIALAVVIYILEHQPSFTLDKSYYTVYAQFQTGAAVTAGQGQTVDIAGVEVGQVGGVKLENGRAVVTMNIFKKYRPIYKDASVLLRPRTPLKDMYLALDPGTPTAGEVPNGGMLSASATSPDVNVDQILAALDTDTRNYLLLLLSGGAGAFQNPGAKGAAPSPSAVRDLRGVFKRFAPLNRETQTFTKLLAQRQRNIRRSIHNLAVVTKSLGSVNGQLTSLIKSSNTNFSAISSQDANLQQALTLLPGTLQQTSTTLGKVETFSNQSATTLHALVPFANAFGPALAGLAAAVQGHHPGDQEPVAAVLGGGAAGRQAARARQRRPGQGHSESGAVLQRAQRAVQHAGLPAQGPEELPVLRLVAGPHRRQPDQRPGRSGTGRARLVHGHLRRAEPVRGRPRARRSAAAAAAGSAQRPRLEQDQVLLLPDGEHPVNKQAPSAGKILTMVAFAASCVGLLLFLWISFGGAVPFAAQGYRMNVEFQDAVQLGVQSDVRISGVSVGKVVGVSLDTHTGLTKAVIQIDPKYAPRPSDTRRDPAGQVAAR